MTDVPPMLAVLVPLEGRVTIVSILRNENEIERLADWIKRGDDRAGLVRDLVAGLRAIDRDEDLRRGEDNR